MKVLISSCCKYTFIMLPSLLNTYSLVIRSIYIYVNTLPKVTSIPVFYLHELNKILFCILIHRFYLAPRHFLPLSHPSLSHALAACLSMDSPCKLVCLEAGDFSYSRAVLPGNHNDGTMQCWTYLPSE